MSARDFTVDVFQNEYLPDGARGVNAIVTVTSAGSAADGMTGPASTGHDSECRPIPDDVDGGGGRLTRLD